MTLDERNQSVRSFVTSYASSEPRDTVISLRITRSLAGRIEEYRKGLHSRQTKTEAIIGILEIGVFVIEKAHSLQDPPLVNYLRENLYNVQLVDDIMGWPQDRIEAIIGALVSEKDRRLRVRIGKAH